jgi:hypothetical protein
MKLVLKKQVGGVMEQQQQLPPELMQLLMSLPKDIQQYVLSLSIEQQVQELTILMQNQLKALQQSPNQNIQRSINQQPQMSQQQQVPQQLAQQQAMKYGGKKLQGGGEVTSQAGKLVKLWSEDGKSFTWHNTKENGKPDIGSTIDVGNNDIFEYNGKIYDVKDVKDYTNNSNNQSQEVITTQAPIITTYTDTKPKRVSGTGSAKGDAMKAKEDAKVIEAPIVSEDNDKSKQTDNLDWYKNYIVDKMTSYYPNYTENVSNGTLLKQINVTKEGLKQEENDIKNLFSNHSNEALKNFTFENIITHIQSDNNQLRYYVNELKKAGYPIDKIKQFVNNVKNNEHRSKPLYQTGGDLDLINRYKQRQSNKSQNTASTNVVLGKSKPKSIGEKIANTVEFIDKYGTAAGLLGQWAKDKDDNSWSKEEIAAAVVGNAIDLFNPLGKAGMLMKGVKGVSKLAKIAKVAGAGVNAFNTASNIANVGDQVYKSKDAFSQGNYGEGIGRAGLALLLGNQVPKNVRGSKDDIVEGSKMIYDKTGKALNAGKEFAKESVATVKRVAEETAPKVKRGMSYLADSQLDEYQKLFGKIKSGLKQADEDLAEIGKNKPSEVEDSRVINLVLGIPNNISDAAGRAALNVSGRVNRGIQAVRDFRLRPEKAEVPVMSKKGITYPIDNSNILNNNREVIDSKLKQLFLNQLSRNISLKTKKPTYEDIKNEAELLYKKYGSLEPRLRNLFSED